MKEIEVIEFSEFEHPLEEVFDLTPMTTVVEKVVKKTELTPIDIYDTKDNELEVQLQEVVDSAMNAFRDQQDSVYAVDPKFKARNQEVAVQFLNTALQAIKEKSMLKQHKDKIYVSAKQAEKPGTVNQNLIVDRQTLLKMLKSKKEGSEANG